MKIKIYSTKYIYFFNSVYLYIFKYIYFVQNVIKDTVYLNRFFLFPGLMPNLKPKSSTRDPTKRRDWRKLNAYYDEKTIKLPKYYRWLMYQQDVIEKEIGNNKNCYNN